MEDFDLCKEIRRAGYRIVYYPEVEINHHHRRLSQGNIARLFTRKVFWHHIISAFRYFWKWKNENSGGL